MRARNEAVAAVVDHGGSLERARAAFPDAPEPWIDLSTGINPHPYPLFDLPETVFARLPEPGDERRLVEAAAQAYGASSDTIVAAPGTQILLPLVASLVAPGRAAVLSPTYSEHARAAALAGHRVVETDRFEALFDADVATLVNPNNPDGEIVARDRLLELARHLKAKGGLLVVDEAFMDVGLHEHSVAGDTAPGGLVILRSFGKFFGLAGLRLGFAIAEPAVAERLRARLGPWAVSGPAIAIGARALAHTAWQEAMRARLAAAAQRLDALLSEGGLDIIGGTSLFRLARHDAAPTLFDALGRAGIAVRRFDFRADALRFGLPADETGWERLAAVLASDWENDIAIRDANR